MAEPNPEYTYEKKEIINWFEDEIETKEGYYSVFDTIAEIMKESCVKTP